MRVMTRASAKILNQLTEGLLSLYEDGAVARKVGTPGGVFMPLVIERLDENTYSLAHYYEQNGDAMRDPEMTFVRADDGQGGSLWYACTFRQDSVHVDQVAAAYNKETGGFVSHPRLQSELTAFANQWLANIKLQHSEFFSPRKGSEFFSPRKAG